jgi:hypothetical protein
MISMQVGCLRPLNRRQEFQLTSAGQAPQPVPGTAFNYLSIAIAETHWLLVPLTPPPAGNRERPGQHHAAAQAPV